jgi:putative ABC transport system substrate-binding protein
MHLGALALALVFLTLPCVGAAQEAAKVWRIGFLSAYSTDHDKSWRAAFRQGVRDLGYVEGKNILIEERHSDGRAERLHALATELVRLPLDVLVAHGPNGSAAAKQATSTIPIVAVAHSDPVGMGVAATLARPGGNVTGLSDQHGDLVAKRLGLLKDAVPSASRIAVLWRSALLAHSQDLRAVQVAAPALRLTVFPLEVKGPQDFDRVFTKIRKERLDALDVLGGAAGVHQRQFAELAIQNRIPTISTGTASSENGLLMSYGAHFPDLYRRAATYVDRILRGAKPGDLPIEQPTKFWLVINMKTAKALGLTIPQSVLLRADRLIE